MDEKPKAQQITTGALALLLWLLSFGLGLECIYVLKELFYLIYGGLGGNMAAAERYVLLLIVILGLVFMIFIIGTAEYHRNRVGTRASWRLFTWSIAVEVSLIALYYILI